MAKDKLKPRIEVVKARKRDSRRMKAAERYFAPCDVGLSYEQVQGRRRDNLVNGRPSCESKSYIKIVTDNVFNFCNLVTLALMILLCAIGAWDYAFSSGIILINMAIGIYQEIKAKKSVEKLNLISESECGAVRDGKTVSLLSSEIVLDDIVVIGAGMRVPVDGIILEGNAELDEAVLTGESRAVKRGVGERVLAASGVNSGEAYIRAERVGKDCYIQKVARIARRVGKPKSRIFNTLDRIIKIISVALVFLAALLLVAERVSVGGSWKDTIITVSSSVLGMIPIGMFLLTSTALAGAVLRLSRKKALPQDLYGVEMLACVDTLLLDKTGTITDGKQEIVGTAFESADADVLRVLATFAAANKDKKSTAKAFDDFCAEAEPYAVSENLPFSSERKYSAVRVEDGMSYALGAPSYVGVPNEAESAYCGQQSRLGRRTMALSRFGGVLEELDRNETEIICFFSLEDKIREDVKPALDWFRANDVEIKIVSGDDPLTVCNIATKAGVFGAAEYMDCARSDAEDLEQAVDKTVFGRISPSGKADIVRALKRRGRTVGMIGDGVNDVAALKESDCSISFGSANEVARNISRIVLLDDDFSLLPQIVRTGRDVIANVQKVSALYIMKNIFVMFMTLVFSIVTLITRRHSYPFDTKKLLLIEFFVIGVPTFIYALQSGAGRMKGDFLRAVLKASIPAAGALILSVGFVMVMNYVVPGGEASEHYRASVAAIALTAAGFSALVIIGMPPDKLRLGVCAVMAALAALAVYIDGSFLSGTFLDIAPPVGWDILWISVGVALCAGAQLLFGKAAVRIDARFGRKISDYNAKIELKALEKSLKKRGGDDEE